MKPLFLLSFETAFISFRTPPSEVRKRLFSNVYPKRD